MARHEIVIYGNGEQPQIYFLEVWNSETGNRDVDIDPIPNATQVLRTYRAVKRAIQRREEDPDFQLTIDASVTTGLPAELGGHQHVARVIAASAIEERTSS